MMKKSGQCLRRLRGSPRPRSSTEWAQNRQQLEERIGLLLFDLVRPYWTSRWAARLAEASGETRTLLYLGYGRDFKSSPAAGCPPDFCRRTLDPSALSGSCLALRCGRCATLWTSWFMLMCAPSTPSTYGERVWVFPVRRIARRRSTCRRLSRQLLVVSDRGRCVATTSDAIAAVFAGYSRRSAPLPVENLGMSRPWASTKRACSTSLFCMVCFSSSPCSSCGRRSITSWTVEAVEAVLHSQVEGVVIVPSSL